MIYIYIYQDSKLLAPVACFAELVDTGLWVEQQAPYTHFQTSQEGIKCTKAKARVSKVLLFNLYTLRLGSVNIIMHQQLLADFKIALSKHNKNPIRNLNAHSAAAFEHIDYDGSNN